MMECVIRPLGKRDLDALEALERECFDLPWSRHAFQSELKNRCAHYIVAEQDGEIVGYAGMWVVIDEAHITNVAVGPEHRRLGYGRRLMRALMRRAADSGVQVMTLEVRKSNKAAQELYARLGFEPCGIRKKYYSNNGEDAVLMWNRSLAEALDADDARIAPALPDGI